MKPLERKGGVGGGAGVTESWFLGDVILLKMACGPHVDVSRSQVKYSSRPLQFWVVSTVKLDALQQTWNWKISAGFSGLMAWKSFAIACLRHELAKQLQYVLCCVVQCCLGFHTASRRLPHSSTHFMISCISLLLQYVTPLLGQCDRCIYRYTYRYTFHRSIFALLVQPSREVSAYC